MWLVPAKVQWMQRVLGVSSCYALEMLFVEG